MTPLSKILSISNLTAFGKARLAPMFLTWEKCNGSDIMKKHIIEMIVDESISQLVKEYGESKSICLTESDAVCRLYMLLTANCSPEALEIHSELRPFDGSIDEPLVIAGIRGKIGWTRQLTASSGDRVDISIVDRGGEPLEKSLAKAKKDQDSSELRYWRILSYPVSAFRAAIETKVKTHKNGKRIDGDIEKLSMIKDRNPDCLLYLVLLDRMSRQSELKKFGRESSNRSVKFCTFSNRC